MDYEIVFIVILVFILLLIATIYIYNYFNSNQITNGGGKGLIYDAKVYTYDELVSLQNSNSDYRTLILNDTNEDNDSRFVNELNIYLQCPESISDDNNFWETLPYIDASGNVPTSQPNNYGGNLKKPLKTQPATQVGDSKVQILTLKPGNWVVLNNPYVGYSQKLGYRITALKNYNPEPGDTRCVNGQPSDTYGKGCPCGVNDPVGCGMPVLFESTIDAVMDLSIVDGCNYSLSIKASIKKDGYDISSKTPYIFDTNPCLAIGKDRNGCLNPSKDGFFKNTNPCIDNNEGKTIPYCVNGSPESSDYNTSLCWNTPCPGTGAKQNNICNLCGLSSTWCQSIQNDKKFGVKPYCYSHGDDGSSSTFIAPYISILLYSNLRDKEAGSITDVVECPSEPTCGSPGPTGPTGPIKTCKELGYTGPPCRVNDYACYQPNGTVACNVDPTEFGKPGYTCNPLCYNGDGPTGTTGTTGTTGSTCNPPLYQGDCNSQCATNAHVCINGDQPAQWGCYANPITCNNYPNAKCESTCQQGQRN